MKKPFEAVLHNPLFRGIGLSDFEAMLSCMEARTQNYKKGEIILLAGNPVESVGLVLSGAVQVVREDADGKLNLLTELQAGDMFGEVFACAGITHSPVTVLSEQNSEVLHINYQKIITTCSSTCTFHHKLVENMLALLAQKISCLIEKLRFYRNVPPGSACFYISISVGRGQRDLPYHLVERNWRPISVSIAVPCPQNCRRCSEKASFGTNETRFRCWSRESENGSSPRATAVFLMVS